MDIAEFLTARYAEEEALAHATTPVPVAGQWCATRDKHAAEDAKLRLVSGRDPYEGEDWNQYESGEYNGAPIIAFSAEWQDEAEANLRYIAHFDPGRVLADIRVKRKIVEMYQGAYEGDLTAPDSENAAVLARKWALRDVIRHLATPYADHPDFQPAWRIDA